MAREITISLDKTTDAVEEYEKDDRNLARVSVYFPDGRAIGSLSHRVVLELSRDAMMGLATELVRVAHGKMKPDGGEHWHIDPVTADKATECMGLYLHPSSCELIITHRELGTVGAAIPKTPNGDGIEGKLH